MADCRKEIKKSYPDVPDKFIDSMLNDLDDVATLLEKTGKMSELPTRLQQQREQLKKLTKAEALERATNAVKKNKLIVQVDSFKDKAEGVLTTLGGSDTIKKGGRNSAEMFGVSLRNKLHDMIKGLDATHLELFKSGKLDAEIAEHMFSEANKTPPTIHISQEARLIAKHLAAVNKELLNAKRSVGLPLGEIHGFIDQTHSADKIRKVSFTEWYSFIKDKLDPEKTFKDGNPDSPESVKAMEHTYESITKERYGIEPSGPTSDNLDNIYKQSKLGNQFTTARKLHFKDGASFAEYNTQFGKGNILDTLVSGVNSDSRKVGLIMKFGTNPKATIESLIKRFDIQEGQANKIRNNYNNLLGINNSGSDSMVAKVGASARSLQSMSKLGKALISSFPDWVGASSIYRANFGGNIMEGMLKLVKNYADPMSAETKKAFAGKMGILLSDHLGFLYTDMMYTDGAAGAISKAQRFFFKINGMEWHTNKSKLAMAISFGEELGEHSTKGYNAIPKRLQAALGTFDIDHRDWLVLTGATETYEGRKMMTAEAIQKVDRNLVQQVINVKFADQKFKPTPEKYLYNLEMSYRNYINDNVDVALLQPGVRTRTTLLGAGTADDPWSQSRRMFAQLKSVPMSTHKLLSRIASSDPEKAAEGFMDAMKGKGDIRGMAEFMSGATVLGGVAMMLKKITEGNDPRIDFTTLENAAQAFVRGGAGGLYGDYLFGAYKSSYQISKNLAGPVFGEALDLVDIYARFDSDKDLSRQEQLAIQRTLKWTARNTPGGNLFYTKWALDKAVWENAYEANDPGYGTRKELRQLKKQYGK